MNLYSPAGQYKICAGPLQFGTTDCSFDENSGDESSILTRNDFTIPCHGVEDVVEIISNIGSIDVEWL